ncbi:MAG: hypothetical protein LBO03_05105 [Acidaminococcales bacterium]|jgi:hypothetical protein|nr:hypothetical protein [Acidaminococcales bacterium]
MWQVVHIAKKRSQAETIKTLLQTEGFWVDMKELDTAGFEIRVLSSEAHEAAEMLHDYQCSLKTAFGKESQK